MGNEGDQVLGEWAVSREWAVGRIGWAGPDGGRCARSPSEDEGQWSGSPQRVWTSGIGGGSSRQRLTENPLSLCSKCWLKAASSVSQRLLFRVQVRGSEHLERGSRPFFWRHSVLVPFSPPLLAGRKIEIARTGHDATAQRHIGGE